MTSVLLFQNSLIDPVDESDYGKIVFFESVETVSKTDGFGTRRVAGVFRGFDGDSSTVAVSAPAPQHRNPTRRPRMLGKTIDSIQNSIARAFVFLEMASFQLDKLESKLEQQLAYEQLSKTLAKRAKRPRKQPSTTGPPE